MKELLIRDTPHELKQALMAAAVEQDSNVQGVAVGLLAEEFGLIVEPGRGQANIADAANPTIKLRMPDELHQLLRVRAAELGIANSDLTLLILGERLGVSIEPERLNRRGRREAVA